MEESNLEDVAASGRDSCQNEFVEEHILKLLGRPDYVPGNVPELLRQLRLPPNRQQDLQRVLRGLEQSGRITRTKGNRYIQSRTADLVAGRIRINRQGKGFLQPDDAGLKEIMVPEGATSTALHEDRVLVRRDVQPKGLRPEAAAPRGGPGAAGGTPGGTPPPGSRSPWPGRPGAGAGRPAPGARAGPCWPPNPPP